MYAGGESDLGGGGGGEDVDVVAEELGEELYDAAATDAFAHQPVVPNAAQDI